MTGRDTTHSFAPVIFILPLLLLLVIMSGAVITAGGQVYSGITRSMDDNYLSRVALSYISEKIRQGDEEDNVSVRLLSGMDCLLIEEKQMQYITCVYLYEGYICESLIESPEDFDPSTGERVIKAEELELSSSDEGINVKITDGIRNAELFTALHSSCGNS